MDLGTIEKHTDWEILQLARKHAQSLEALVLTHRYGVPPYSATQEQLEDVCSEFLIKAPQGEKNFLVRFLWACYNIIFFSSTGNLITLSFQLRKRILNEKGIKQLNCLTRFIHM